MNNNEAIHTQTTTRLGRLAATLALAGVAAGCASVPNPTPEDPWESYNRSMFQFNEAVDKALFKPIARGYRDLTPEPARTCIHNIFANMADLWASVNSFLQGRGHDGVNMLGRVLFNTTMGLGGCIDVASKNGVKRIPNDFGVTLGVWGFKPGPYVVLPFLGSSNVRDGAGIGAMTLAGASSYTGIMAIDNVPLRNTILAVAAIDLRERLLDADDLVDRIALDRYSFIRDAYIQRRKALVEGQHVAPGAPYGSLPYYSDDNLPDYSDDEDDDATAAPAPATGTAPAAQ
ncbi:MAG TPA: VacJ family lipoprotein [Pusillimonas sp.]|uniref:MlaA family lipoprotein n=1 Tax=unclassified Pusillimonas TaxID=2640016 RepID=UPI00260E91C5|nr:MULTISPECIES: VacJ family lipoprotein [unclassified Pusillimonas]HLU18937.1 VacJ family lipoprotein [Pusillimonas sp.]